jgi:hypothetical protein
VIKKVLTWGLIAFLVFYVVTQPNESARILRALGNGVRAIATGLGNFVNSLSG